MMRKILFFAVLTCGNILHSIGEEYLDAMKRPLADHSQEGERVARIELGNKQRAFFVHLESLDKKSPEIEDFHGRLDAQRKERAKAFNDLSNKENGTMTDDEYFEHRQQEIQIRHMTQVQTQLEKENPSLRHLRELKEHIEKVFNENREVLKKVGFDNLANIQDGFIVGLKGDNESFDENTVNKLKTVLSEIVNLAKENDPKVELSAKGVSGLSRTEETQQEADRQLAIHFKKLDELDKQIKEQAKKNKTGNRIYVASALLAVAGIGLALITALLNKKGKLSKKDMEIMASVSAALTMCAGVMAMAGKDTNTINKDSVPGDKMTEVSAVSL